jgi:hypothetical protein
MAVNSLTIDGVKYVPESTAGPTSIVVIDRGFVLHGVVTKIDSYVVIDHCSCIRAWGTTRGLGQLAETGPTSTTKLDPQPRTRVHELQVVQIIECKEAATWKQ